VDLIKTKFISSKNAIIVYFSGSVFPSSRPKINILKHFSQKN